MYNMQFETHSHWEGSLLFKSLIHKVIKDKDLCSFLSDGSRSNDEQYNSLRSLYPDIEWIDPHSDPDPYKHPTCQVAFNSLSAYNDKIYEKMNKKNLLNIFEFSDMVKNTDAYKFWESKAGTYDIAHLRRDDISNPDFNRNNIQGYSVISKNSYYRAFQKYGFDSSNILWVSDDYINKWHIDRPKTENFGWSYPTGSIYRPKYIFDWLEDFLKIYFARNVFRANSSFSWWACFLSPTATVYSPVLDKQVIYGRNNRFEEIDVEFIQGNSPHWMYRGTKSGNIIIPDK